MCVLRACVKGGEGVEREKEREEGETRVVGKRAVTGRAEKFLLNWKHSEKLGPVGGFHHRL